MISHNSSSSGSSSSSVIHPVSVTEDRLVVRKSSNYNSDNCSQARLQYYSPRCEIGCCSGASTKQFKRWEMHSGSVKEISEFWWWKQKQAEEVHIRLRICRTFDTRWSIPNNNVTADSRCTEWLQCRSICIRCNGWGKMQQRRSSGKFRIFIFFS